LTARRHRRIRRRVSRGARRSVLTYRVIPCLDVAHGRVVKGVNFLALRDAGDPVEQARAYDSEGADEITFLDIGASHEERETMVELVSRTVAEVFIPVTVGGGIRSVADAQRLLRAGADKVSVNSSAVADPALLSRLAEAFGSQAIVVAIDARARPEGGFEVFTHGGRRSTGRDVVAWAAEVTRLGAGEILLTSMDRDGTKQGFDLAMLRAVRAVTRLPIVASGGVGSAEHFVAGARAGATGLLAASVFHFGEMRIADAKAALRDAGLAVRPPPQTELT
jgi:cyclase